MRRISLLTFLEVLAMAGWVALAGVSLFGEDGGGGSFVPIDAAALAQGALAEEWMGIYVEDQKIGYAFTGTASTAEGGRVIQGRSFQRMQLFGQDREIVQAGVAVVDAAGRLQRFDLMLRSEGVQLSARGAVRGSSVDLEIEQGGEVSRLALDLEEPPQIGLTLGSFISEVSEGDLREGQSFEVPYFSPTSLSQATMHLRVVDTEILPDGNEAFWVEREFDGVVTRVLISRGGETLREEMSAGGLPIWSVRETREQAVAMPEDIEPVDFIALSSVPLVGRLDRPRERRSLTLRATGEGAEHILNEPPIQTVSGDRVTVSVPLREELPSLPRAEDDPALAGYLATTTFLAVDHRDIQDQAEKLVGAIEDREEAVQVLVDWVYRYLEKTPVVGVPSALEVLHTGRGDCNEHTALFVALARARGIPARIAAGLVYSDRVSQTGAFYYHAWPEVWFGPEGGWVPVDPTFGQLPADATHIKLVEGDLARQLELMQVMGRIGFERIGDGP